MLFQSDVHVLPKPFEAFQKIRRPPRTGLNDGQADGIMIRIKLLHFLKRNKFGPFTGEQQSFTLLQYLVSRTYTD